MNLLKCLMGTLLLVALVACGGGGGNASSPPTSQTSTANSSVGNIRITSSSSTLSADGTTALTFTIYALTSGNAAVSGATIDLTATNGVVLGSASVVTTSTGATVTMIADSSDQTSRTSTLTASCSGCTASPVSSLISIVGATISLTNSGGTSLVVGGSNATLSATVKNAFGAPMSGVTMSFAATDSSVLGLNAPTGVTNTLGVATVTVSGIAAGSASVNASALGDAKSQAYTSGVATAVLAVTSPANNASMITNVAQIINVSAPGATSVTFTATRGSFANGTASETVAVAGGVASATLTSAQAGTSTVTIFDSLSRSTNLTLIVSPPVSSVNKILLNASQTTLPVATSGVASLSLTARAVLFDGTTDQSVANVPIEFSMTGGPGAGEFLSPALAYTNNAGYAVATVTAGTAASTPNGIVVSAKVQGTAVKTGTSPSSNNVQLTIGGQALSVAFGSSSVLGESSDKTLYIQAYSVQVTDANNNPVAGQTVTLRLRPVAFKLGSICNVTAIYCAEDANGNDSLESASEDGARTSLALGSLAGSCPTIPPAVTGSRDGILTPQNSDGGGVPSTVTTDANGIAAFNHTYLKSEALWIVNKLTATVSSSGTETSRSTIIEPGVAETDVKPPTTCHLSDSPYAF
ncbi:MAG: Ig-like domain-containing protein [Rhodoferax sp.]|nr:Ig-like domain-containing protein [Rhodoferax sp.]MDP3652515.1 Ig-like domain-containing protein [Rhodoferax sp.]